MIGREKYSFLTLGFALFLLFAMVMPVSGSPHVFPINTTIVTNSAQFQAVINETNSGDIIDLEPGTYDVHNLTFYNTLTIESNITMLGNTQNTTLDGQSILSARGIIGNGTSDVIGTSIIIRNLTLKNGWTEHPSGGGAVLSDGDIVVFSSNFINDSALPNHYGGALSDHGGGGNITVSGSNFVNCSAGIFGGAIYDDIDFVSVNSSSFVNDYATASGSAIYGEDGVNATFCRFSNILPTDSNIIESYIGDVYAPDNWWGTNNPVQSTILSAGGISTINPWLNLTVTSTPVTKMGQTSSIQAYLTSYNDSTLQYNNIPTNGMPVSFTVIPTTSGTMNPSSGTFMTMQSPASIFTPSIGGPATVEVTVDAETIPINFDIAPILTGITPANAFNTTAIPITIAGNGFYNTTTTLPTVNLTQNGYNNVTLTNVNVSSVTSINGTIPLGIPAGVWNVVITNPDGLESTNASVTFTATQYVPTPTMTPTPIVTQHHGTPYNGGGQTGGNTQNGYTGPQPASQGGVPAKPVVVQQEAPPENTPIASITALAPVQNPSILAMVILTLQEYQFWLILAVIIIILVAVLRRWWIKRQNPLLFKK